MPYSDAAGGFSLPPSSILNVLATAVPTSVLGEMDNVSAISAWAYGLASSIENSQTPGWVASLPPSVKSYLYTAYVTNTGAAASATPTPATTGGATTPATTSASSGSSPGTTATSTGGAPAATGALAAGLTGAVGVLGLALAL